MSADIKIRKIYMYVGSEDVSYSARRKISQNGTVLMAQRKLFISTNCARFQNLSVSKTFLNLELLCTVISAN